MNNKKEYSYLLIIIAVVLGWTIFKQFDFEKLKFEKPAMAVVYTLTFLMTVYFKKGKGQRKITAATIEVFVKFTAANKHPNDSEQTM